MFSLSSARRWIGQTGPLIKMILSTSGTDSSRSHLETACLDTPSRSATAPGTGPAALRNCCIFSPKLNTTPPLYAFIVALKPVAGNPGITWNLGNRRLHRGCFFLQKGSYGEDEQKMVTPPKSSARRPKRFPNFLPIQMPAKHAQMVGCADNEGGKEDVLTKQAPKPKPTAKQSMLVATVPCTKSSR